MYTNQTNQKSINDITSRLALTAQFAVMKQIIS